MPTIRKVNDPQMRVEVERAINKMKNNRTRWHYHKNDKSEGFRVDTITDMANNV